MSNRKRVIIVGAGFAGLNCARVLAEDASCDVTLIDRNDYQQFQPLLYQVATGALSTQNAAFSLRVVFSAYENVEVVTSEIVSVDLDNLTVTAKDGHRYTGDYLVLAAGTEVNFFNTAGSHEHSFPLYSLVDAERLRSRLFGLLEEADLNPSSISPAGLSIVVVGGGPTGVEIAGAVADILRLTPKHIYPNIDLTRISVTLVDAQQAVLSPFTTDSQEYAKQVLEDRGVTVRLGTMVKEVNENCVVFGDGSELAATLVIWAGGLKAAALSHSIAAKTGPGGRLTVDDDLTIPGHSRVYALGDFANTKDDKGVYLPQLGAVAQQAGKHCAHNILAEENGSERTAFKYRDKGIMAMIGRNAAVAELGSHHLPISGPLAFATWLGVHAALLTSFRAELEAIIEWTWDYARGIPMNPIRIPAEELQKR